MILWGDYSMGGGGMASGVFWWGLVQFVLISGTQSFLSYFL
jgi:hypothetical protein